MSKKRTKKHTHTTRCFSFFPRSERQHLVRWWDRFCRSFLFPSPMTMCLPHLRGKGFYEIENINNKNCRNAQDDNWKMILARGKEQGQGKPEANLQYKSHWAGLKVVWSKHKTTRISHAHIHTYANVCVCGAVAYRCSHQMVASRALSNRGNRGKRWKWKQTDRRSAVQAESAAAKAFFFLSGADRKRKKCIAP